MKVSTRGRYAIRALIYLVNHVDEGPVSLQAISENEGISLTYLGQIFFHLKKLDIVKSVRGPGGGYVLKKKPEEISLAEITKAAEEPIVIAECLENPERCEKSNLCPSRILWLFLYNIIEDFLKNVTLADFKNKNITDLYKKLSEVKSLIYRDNE